MNPRIILTDIHALEEEIIGFERKYGVRSETFYTAYISGEEPEDDAWVLDFGEWASVYRTWLARQADYRNEVQRVQCDSPNLSNLYIGSPRLVHPEQSADFMKEVIVEVTNANV